MRNGWTRQQLLVAFHLYCQMPFGKLHSRNPDIIEHAKLIDRTPSALAMKLTNIASLDPAITLTGRKGLQGASAADKAMWKEMQENWEKFAIEARHALHDFGANVEFTPEADDTLKKDHMINYSGKNSIAQTKVRIGQDFFRRSVLSAYNYRCCITGLSVPQLLVASHIIPWSVDEKNRLNPRNGLCLSMLHDKAFDSGIIAISNEMTVRVSPKYVTHADHFFSSVLLAYDGKPIDLPEKFHPLPEFLAYHRQHIFDANS